MNSNYECDAVSVKRMPVDPLALSSFLGNEEESADRENVSSAAELNLIVQRKRKYVEDEILDSSSSKGESKSAYYYSNPESGNDFLEADREGSSLSQKTDDSPDSCADSSHNLDITKPARQTEDSCEMSRKYLVVEKFETLDMLQNDGITLENCAKDLDAGPASMQPVKALLEELAEELKEQTLRDWRDTFSDMERFETDKVRSLDQILQSALAYERKLKSQKAELHHFLVKLSDSLKQD